MIQESTLSKRGFIAHLVVIADDENSMILGVFLNSESAQEFALTVMSETGLPITDGELEEYQVVVGDKAILGNDEKAIRNRKRIKPIQIRPFSRPGG